MASRVELTQSFLRVVSARIALLMPAGQKDIVNTLTHYDLPSVLGRAYEIRDLMVTQTLLGTSQFKDAEEVQAWVVRHIETYRANISALRETFAPIDARDVQSHNFKYMCRNCWERAPAPTERVCFTCLRILFGK